MKPSSTKSRILPALLLLTTLLGGCSSFQSAPPALQTTVPASWQQYQTWMSQQQRWELSGKAGIRTARENNSAGVSWQQQGELSDIRLSGPFNAQAARIQGSPQRITLEVDGQRYQAESPEALLQQQLGWQLPVRELVWWVRGLPAPGSPSQHSLQNERLQTLSQKNWQIRYSRYSESFRLPEKLVLQFQPDDSSPASAAHQQLRIILVIHDWKIFQ